MLWVAVTTAAVAAGVAHGVLRPQLEGRGVAPWRVRDTLAATPLILVGSAGVGASSATVAGWLAGMPVGGGRISVTMALAAAVVLLALAALILMLGIIALRKLH